MKRIEDFLTHEVIVSLTEEEKEWLERSNNEILRNGLVITYNEDDGVTTSYIHYTRIEDVTMKDEDGGNEIRILCSNGSEYFITNDLSLDKKFNYAYYKALNAAIVDFFDKE